MVAIVTSLIFVGAMIVAIGVIASMIAAERQRILALMEGSLREVALPRAIAIRRDQAPHRPLRSVPARASLHAAA